MYKRLFLTLINKSKKRSKKNGLNTRLMAFYFNFSLNNNLAKLSKNEFGCVVVQCKVGVWF